MTHLYRACVVLACAFLVACGNVSGVQAGDPLRGQQLFNGEVEPLMEGGAASRCNDCHAVEAGGQAAVIGNNLSNIGNRAATTVPGQDARTYLNESIVEPDKYLSGGFQEGIHPRNYRQALTDQQIDDLIAYMLTLKSGKD